MKEVKDWGYCTLAQKIERWENVRRVLKGLTKRQREKEWNMSVWGEKNACGTHACAAGWCGLDPWFRRRGMKLEFEEIMRFDLSENEEVLTGEFNGDLSVNPQVFFGGRGTDKIFYRVRKRPVEKVIKEVEAHIEWLKKHPNEA